MSSHGDVASATFRDGSQIEADAIIGADGIHSAVRASLFGEDAPRFTGKICYRSVIPVEAIPGGPPPPENVIWMGPHGAIVVYGMRRGELINVVSHYDDETYKHESWITQCDRDEVIERYSGWHESLERLFSAGELWYKWALYDRDPIPRWTSGRASVLGDAAHPMLPYLGQGACQSMEDGCVLAAALAANPDDMPAGLELYERARRPRASRVVITSRERGVDNHLTSPLAAWRRDLMIAVRKRTARIRRDAAGAGSGTTTPARRVRSPHEAAGRDRRGRCCARLLWRGCARRGRDRQARLAVGLDPRGCDADGAGRVPGCAEVRQRALLGRRDVGWSGGGPSPDLAEVRILEAQSVEGGSLYEVRVRNGNAAGSVAVRVTVTATTVEPRPHSSTLRQRASSTTTSTAIRISRPAPIAAGACHWRRQKSGSARSRPWRPSGGVPTQSSSSSIPRNASLDRSVA